VKVKALAVLAVIVESHLETNPKAMVLKNLLRVQKKADDHNEIIQTFSILAKGINHFHYKAGIKTCFFFVNFKIK
jgi:hypothetical protein